MIEITPAVRSIYPNAKFGIMIVKGLHTTSERSSIDTVIAAEIEQMKSKFPNYERKAILETEPLCHYVTYYKKFKKTYPVLGQLESVLLKGKIVPPVGMPIEAMFLAEMKNLLLTAGHDLDLIVDGLTVDVVVEPTNYQGISGKEQQLVKDDLYLSDKKSVLSSIMNGPDYRTKITEVTQNALYFVYGVEGVTERQIQEHLQAIFSCMSQVIQSAEVQSIKVL